MILFGYSSREDAIERHSQLPLSKAMVRAVARSSLTTMGVHVAVGSVVTLALLEASERMSGLIGGIVYLLFSLSAFYVFFGLIAIYAVFKTRTLALRDVDSSLDYDKDVERRRTFWTLHRELFPPSWR